MLKKWLYIFRFSSSSCWWSCPCAHASGRLGGQTTPSWGPTTRARRSRRAWSCVCGCTSTRRSSSIHWTKKTMQYFCNPYKPNSSSAAKNATIYGNERVFLRAKCTILFREINIDQETETSSWNANVLLCIILYKYSQLQCRRWRRVGWSIASRFANLHTQTSSVKSNVCINAYYVCIIAYYISAKLYTIHMSYNFERTYVMMMMIRY